MGGRPLVLLGYLLFSFSSHLLLPALPDFLQGVITGVWSLFSLCVLIYVLPGIFIDRGTDFLKLPYRQIPVKPVFLIAYHVVFIFATKFISLTAWVFFVLFTPATLPNNVNLLSAVNIFSLGLFATAISLGFTMFTFLFFNRKEFLSTLLVFAALCLVVYLLLFQISLDLRDILGLLIITPFGLPEATAFASVNLLQTPWGTAWSDIMLLMAALLLQCTSMTCMLSGKVDAL